MLQDHITVRLRHEKFVRDVSRTHIVFALENKEGLATSSSNVPDDENDEEVELICFWSEKPRARSCIKNGWSDYQVTEIPLADFLEDWCVGMGNDGIWIGTNFDQNMFGYEIDPYELILEITAELIKNNRTISFRKYCSVQELDEQVKAALGIDS